MLLALPEGLQQGPLPLLTRVLTSHQRPRPL